MFLYRLFVISIIIRYHGQVNRYTKPPVLSSITIVWTFGDWFWTMNPSNIQISIYRRYLVSFARAGSMIDLAFDQTMSLILWSVANNEPTFIILSRCCFYWHRRLASVPDAQIALCLLSGSEHHQFNRIRGLTLAAPAAWCWIKRRPAISAMITRRIHPSYYRHPLIVLYQYRLNKVEIYGSYRAWSDKDPRWDNTNQ